MDKKEEDITWYPDIEGYVLLLRGILMHTDR